jgi:hypothetical protein
MAIGKFQGVMRPTTPIGSRCTITSTPGRTLGISSPASRSASPAKKSKICPAWRLRPWLNKRLALLAGQEPPEFLLARQDSSDAFFRMSWRCWMPERDQAGKAALAAAIAPLCIRFWRRAHSGRPPPPCWKG